MSRGTSTDFWWGNEISAEQANYDGSDSWCNEKKGDYRQRTVPVKTFEPNPCGLYQVHGNVWEWCQDAEDDMACVCGGSWRCSPLELGTSDDQFWYQLGARRDDLGFRVMRVIGFGF